MMAGLPGKERSRSLRSFPSKTGLETLLDCLQGNHVGDLSSQLDCELSEDRSYILYLFEIPMVPATQLST